MKGLLVKDFRLMLQQKNFFLIICFVAIMLGFGYDSSFIISYLTFICSLFVLSTISYDEYDNGYPFLMTLPISRKSYAAEKYIFGLLIGSMAWMIGNVLTVVFQILNGKAITFMDDFLVYITYIPLFMILLSITIPFQLKFGAEKGRIVMFGTFGVAFFIGYLLSKLGTTMGVDLEKTMNSLSNIHLGVLQLLLAIITIFVVLLSYIISTKIMERKEF